MKLLLDSCVARSAARLLTEAGHEVEHAAQRGADPGDSKILQDAFAEDRALVTLDKDFGELAVVRGLPHHGIVRLVGVPARQQGAVCIEVIERYGEALAAGALVTVEPGRVRIRSANV